MTSKPSFAPSFWRALAAENPLGITLDEQDARDWWEMVWPRYREHGYTRHRRAVLSWWSRVTMQELHRARERGRRLREGSAGALPFPPRLSEPQRAELLRFARKSGFTPGQLTHAVKVVRKWAEKDHRVSESWVLVIELAMLRGWALDGFDRDRRPGPGYVNERPQDDGWRENTLDRIGRDLRLIEGGK